MGRALFDFDSTITTRDTFAHFIHDAAPPARRWWAHPLLLPVFVGYRMGVVSGHFIRASAVRVGLSGVPLAHASAKGEQFALEVLKQILRAELMVRID